MERLSRQNYRNVESGTVKRLPLSYNARNVRVRWRATLLAVLSLAIVVAVFTVLMSMSEGFAIALRSTGRVDNALIFQRGSSSELTSFVSLDDRNTILADRRLSRKTDGHVLASWDLVVIMVQPRKSDGGRTSVTLRGVPPHAFEVRGGIRVITGRRFTPGLNEVIVGRKIAERVSGLQLNSTFKCQRKAFKVVGIFESDGLAFESEVWGDFETLESLFHRSGGSNSLVVRMTDPAQIPELDGWLRSHPQMQLRAISERQYYENQAGLLSMILKGLAGLVALIMGIGAVFGVMNTMYAMVAARTREIGTLRAIGFSRRAILFSFVVESAVLAFIGGVIGCLLAFPMHGFSTGTAHTPSFSEIAFAFRITPSITALSLMFAVGLGVAGGLLPAMRAARMSISSALQEG